MHRDDYDFGETEHSTTKFSRFETEVPLILQHVSTPTITQELEDEIIEIEEYKSHSHTVQKPRVITKPIPGPLLDLCLQMLSAG
jgi:hypothetical protein